VRASGAGIGLNKDLCLEYPDCPLAHKEPMSCYVSPCAKRSGKKLKPKKKIRVKPCPVEGCRNTCRETSYCCDSHQSMMGYRRRIGMPPAIICLKEPPANWREQYGVYQWPVSGRRK
jgi:hypothetical protein